MQKISICRLKKAVVYCAKENVLRPPSSGEEGEEGGGRRERCPAPELPGKSVRGWKKFLESHHVDRSCRRALLRTAAVGFVCIFPCFHTQAPGIFYAGGVFAADYGGVRGVDHSADDAVHPISVNLELCPVDAVVRAFVCRRTVRFFFKRFVRWKRRVSPRFWG